MWLRSDFFQKALKQPHTVDPTTIAVDKSAAHPAAARAMKREESLWRFVKLRQVKFLNNFVAQGHRRIKQQVRPGLGFKSFVVATQTIAGYEAMTMVRESPMTIAPANDVRAESDFIAVLFSTAA
jgi:IS6 family transposase